MSVNFKAEGFHSVTAYLIVDNAGAAIEFYRKAFGATETLRMPGPEGKIMHAEVTIGDSPVMLADEFPEMGARSPKSVGGSPVGLMIYTEDADAMFTQAIAAGATEERPLADQFYGDRSGTVVDPFGHKWTIATHTEDLTPEEIAQRMQAMQQGGEQ